MGVLGVANGHSPLRGQGTSELPERLMRICILTPTFLPTIGGIENSVDQMARAMLGLGHHVTVVTERARRGGGSIDRRLPYPVHRYFRPWSSRWGLQSVSLLIHHLQRVQGFDVVHAMVTQPTGYVAWRLHQNTGVPVVVTPRGDDIWETSRYRSRPAIWKRIQETLRNAPVVTGIGRHMAHLIRELTGGRSVPVIHNGVDHAVFSRRPEHPADARLARFGRVPFILGLGRLVEQKGFDRLIRAFGRVAADWPDYQLVIAGDGPMRAELCQWIEKLGLRDRVHLPGAVRGDDRLFLLHESRCVAVCSHYEGYCNVVLEAMCCGRPVLATRIPSLEEVVCNGVNGVLVPENSEEGIAAALDANLSAARLERLVAGARATAAAHRWPIICGQYLEAYQSAAGALRAA